MKKTIFIIIIFILTIGDCYSQFIWSTYIGGDNWDWFYDFKIDSSGNSYIAGTTRSSNFPITSGCYDSLFKDFNIFVTKLNVNGSDLIFSTFIPDYTISGTWLYDNPSNLAIDKNNNLYITGYSQSGHYPTTVNAFDTSQHVGIFITKFNLSGSALIYSSFFGPGMGTGVAIDTSCNVYFTGTTISGYPVTYGAYNQIYSGGNSDIFVTKLNSIDYSLNYSTYIGGSDCEGFYGCNCIGLDKNNNVLIGGWTSSNNFPITKNAFDTIFEMKTDSNSCDYSANKFITKLNRSGSTLIYSTFIRGDSLDFMSLSIDYLENAYITGMTTSKIFPTTSGSYDRSYNDNGNYGDIFVSKLNPIGNNLLYSTFIGGDKYDASVGVVVDNKSNVYITGGTSSKNFPLTNNAFDTIFKEGFLTELDSSGSYLIFSTYIQPTPTQIALNSKSQIYLAGISDTNLITTYDAYDRTYNGKAHDPGKPSGVYTYDIFEMKLQLCTGNGYNLQAKDYINFGEDICTKLDTIYVKNTGECILNIDSCKFTGTNASQFSLVSPNSFIVSIMPGDSMPFVVQFASNKIAGAKKATMSLNYFRQTSPWLIDLQGNSLVSGIQSDSIFKFIPAFCGSNSTDTFYVKSRGDCDLTIDSLYLSGFSAGRFKILKPDSLPLRLQTGDSVKIIILYSSDSYGIQTATLSLRNNSPDSLWSINLSAYKIWNDLLINGLDSDTIIIDLGTVCKSSPSDTVITIFNNLPAGYYLKINKPDNPTFQILPTGKAGKKEGDKPKKK
jgi:hypothetical protein